MRLIDCHAHLTDVVFTEDCSQVIERALDAHVRHIVCVSMHCEDALCVERLCSEFSGTCLPMLGLHPEYVSSDINEAKQHLESIFRVIDSMGPSLVGIGEIGLDFRPSVLSRFENQEEGKSMQRFIFESQIEKARSLHIPINVHSRSAGRHALEMIPPDVKAIVHAFDGKASYAEKAILNGQKVFFSIPPCIVRTPGFEKLAARIPSDHLLLESDSPALAPVVNQRNEPALIEVALRSLATLKGQEMGEMAESLFANTSILFGSHVT